MFEKIEVWHSSQDNGFVYVFVCFRDVRTNSYYVQNVDALRINDGIPEIANIRRNTIELFLEQDVSEREKAFSSLKDAVEAAMQWSEIKS